MDKIKSYLQPYQNSKILKKGNYTFSPLKSVQDLSKISKVQILLRKYLKVVNVKGKRKHNNNR